MTNTTRRAVLGLVPGFLAAPALIRAAHAGGHLRLPVNIQGNAFNPNTIEIGQGDYVVFTNADGAPHTATARDGFFDSGNLNRGDSFEVRMTQTGTFDFFCRIHPGMTGTITVT
ncbi:MAG TPA: copper-binding protein [Roseibacterium sp.]|nr:copper-binding protein [Roseibacterium sp.]